METIVEQIAGPYTLTQDTAVHGTVSGSVTVPHGLSLLLHGFVTGDLTVERGGMARVHGNVDGTVINHGADVRVYGMVDRVIDQDKANPTFISSRAIILSE